MKRIGTKTNKDESGQNTHMYIRRCISSLVCLLHWVIDYMKNHPPSIQWCQMNWFLNISGIVVLFSFVYTQLVFKGQDCLRACFPLLLINCTSPNLYLRNEKDEIFKTLSSYSFSRLKPLGCVEYIALVFMSETAKTKPT